MELGPGASGTCSIGAGVATAVCGADADAATGSVITDVGSAARGCRDAELVARTAGDATAGIRTARAPGATRGMVRRRSISVRASPVPAAAAPAQTAR